MCISKCENSQWVKKHKERFKHEKEAKYKQTQAAKRRGHTHTRADWDVRPGKK